MGQQTDVFGNAVKSALCPLFWQHGESSEVLEEEIRRMKEGGIGAFIVESRPHPDFLSYGWWRDLDVIISEAKKQGMGVWIFDDSAYPSGLGAGKIRDLYPEARKRYITKQQIDAIGPLQGASIQVGHWLGEEDRLLKGIAARRVNGNDELDVATLTDLTGLVQEGMLYWDIPDGPWRVFLLINTRDGGEEWTKDYVNPISKAAVDRYIDVIYEEHYKRYREEFGRTVKGFFIDEPRFGSASSYENTLGKRGFVYPWSEEVMDALCQEFGDDAGLYLPLLWSRENPECRDVQYAYMNVVSHLFDEDFTGRIGEWCRSHGVKVIGHIVEDNGAHARLGFGPGHYFRSMNGFDTAGIDVVYQVWPGYTDGYQTTPFGYLDCRFFYWGLAKMASSAAHLDPKKNGITICEIFGAYGWQEGLALMKWLTDHVCVRGVNVLVPHAFSPKFPDADCPPHFYARGKNPQWNYFHYWSSYANRVCGLLTGGVHHATAAVLYHGEAEWGGAYEPFEKTVKVLMESQIDCDVLPADLFTDPAGIRAEDGLLIAGQESYRAVLVPYGESMPRELLASLDHLAAQGVPVLFMEGFPKHVYYGKDEQELLARIAGNGQICVCRHEELQDWMFGHGCYDLETDGNYPDLRFLHYEKEGRGIYFFTNESRSEMLTARISIREEGTPVLYDAMLDQCYPAEETVKDGRLTFVLELAPYQSLFLLMNAQKGRLSDRIPVRGAGTCGEVKKIPLADGWVIRVPDDSAVNERLESLSELKNLAAPGLAPEYSGTVCYEKEFCLEESDTKGRIYLDLGDVYEISEVTINGVSQGVRICPPHTFELTCAAPGHNLLQIKVTNTFAKKMHGNIFDRAMAQEPAGLLGPAALYIRRYSLGEQP